MTIHLKLAVEDVSDTIDGDTSPIDVLASVDYGDYPGAITNGGGVKVRGAELRLRLDQDSIRPAPGDTILLSGYVGDYPSGIVEMAERAYRAYGRATGGKNYRGEPMPQWADLGDTIQGAWREAVAAVVDLLTGEPPDTEQG